MMGERIDGRYELVERLGAGGMAEVWQARDERTGATVAVKRLFPHLRSDASALERFRREAAAASAVRHPGAVAVRHARIDRDEAYLVMDHVPGGSLADLLARAGRLPADAAVSIAAQVAEVLAEAHRLGIVHRDVTPANILLDPVAGARLADFGIARAMDDDAAVTVFGDVVGTLRYLPPEVLAGEPSTPAGDVWSLGAVLYEAISGQAPYDSAALASMLAARAAPPAPIPGQSETLQALLARMLDPDPAGRPADGAEAVTALRGVAEAMDAPASPDDPTVVIPRAVPPMVAAAPATFTEPDRAPGRRVRAASGSLLVGGVLLVGLAVLAAGPFENPGPGPSVSPDVATAQPAATAMPAATPVATRPVAAGGVGPDAAGKAKGEGKGKGKSKGKGHRNGD